jgi:PAS domain S-box-containing protein
LGNVTTESFFVQVVEQRASSTLNLPLPTRCVLLDAQIHNPKSNPLDFRRFSGYDKSAPKDKSPSYCRHNGRNDVSDAHEEPGGDILIVDDDPYSRMWARRWLEGAGYTMREADCAADALALVAENPPDLILQDVILPDMNGFELTRQLRQNPALVTTPIVVLTVLDDVESKVQGLESGANDFLTKLPEREELLARVRTHLRLKRNQEALLAEQRKTALLYRINRELSAELELDAILSRILELTIASVGTTHGSVLLLDEQGGILRCITTYRGQSSTVMYAVPGEIVQQGLAGWVIQHREGAILPNTREDPRWVTTENAHAAAGSALAVPLIHQERVAGVLTLTNGQADYFTADHLSLLESIASQAAVALDNARLFAAVEQERGRLQAILSGATEAIVATDPKLRVTLLNPAAEDTFGVRAGQVVGWPLEEALPYEALVRSFRRARETDTLVPPAELPLPSGRTLFFTVSAVAVGPRGEGGWVAVMQDITHLKEVNRLKNDFVSVVSHDLRTPLATIHGYGEVLAKSTEGECREVALRIQAESQRLAALVEDLLDLGKIESGVEVVREPCHLEGLIDEAVESAGFAAQSAGVTIQAQVAPLSKAVLGSAVRLRQVMDNLIGNALKYTGTGGDIWVQAWEREDQITVTVQDSGVGIPRESLPRIFEKFYRVPERGERRPAGTGLGLAIVKAIVEQHGGTVWVESELGKGSTFGFSLPCIDDQEV